MVENCFNTCPYKEDIDEIKRLHEKESEKNSEQHKEFYEAITDIKLSQKETQSDIKIVKNEMSNMSGILAKVESATEEIKQKPSKKLDALEMAIIASAVTSAFSIAGALVNKFF